MSTAVNVYRNKLKEHASNNGNNVYKTISWNNVYKAML